MRITLKSVAVLLCGALALHAQALPQGVLKRASIAGITEYEFPNGLRVLLFPDASSPKITVNMNYLVGSRHEGYGETGMAHLLEHMNFIETTNGRNIKKEIVDRGAQWNGTTDYDRTNYFETFTATDENLNWALGLEADRMVNVRMDKVLLDTEMTVVRNEFERGENSSDRVLEERVLSTAYLWHNYGKSVIGSRVDIERVPVERLAAFYRRFYQPDNAVLVIAGQIDTAKTLGYVARTCGAIPRPTRRLDNTYTVEPVQDGERNVELRRVGTGQSIMIAWHAPAMAHPDAAALEVLTGVLNGSNGTGRLSKALVDNGKALSARIFFREMHDPGFVLASASLSADQSLDAARKMLIETIAGIATEPPSDTEVERVKTRILRSMERTLANSQQMAMTLTSVIADGDWRLYFLNYEQIRASTPADVVRVAKLYFKASNRTAGLFIPDAAPDRTVVPDTPDIESLLKEYKGAISISAGELFAPTPANIEKHITRAKLPNGLKMALLPRPTRGGGVFATLNLRMGDEKSLAGKNAVAHLTGALLMRGTKNKTRQQLQDEMDKLDARISVRGGGGRGGSAIATATASIQTTAANLVPALRLAVEILREPAFSEADFEQIRRQQIGAIERGRTEPGSLSVEALQRNLSPFPRGDVRYVRTIDEQIEDLNKVTPDDVKAFHAAFYGASNGELAAVGQFDPAELRKAAEDLLGGWASPSPYVRVPSPYRAVTPVNLKIETPDKQNAQFEAGLRIRMRDTDPDYPAMVLAGYIFGGSITSRLPNRVRNAEGLSYSVGAQFSAPADGDAALFSAAAISNPRNAPKLEASFRDELSKALASGFTADEVRIAKKALHDQRVVSRSQDQTLLALILAREEFDRTLLWDEQMDAKLEALTMEDVNSAFRRHVDPAAMAVVKAGDFKSASVYQ